VFFVFFVVEILAFAGYDGTLKLRDLTQMGRNPASRLAARPYPSGEA